jgi:beta-lactamase regulating signal transducer with metallopeptidase domain
MSNNKHPYLRKGEGKLASQDHGITSFSLKRKQKIIQEQEEREANPIVTSVFNPMIVVPDKKM